MATRSRTTSRKLALATILGMEVSALIWACVPREASTGPALAAMSPPEKSPALARERWIRLVGAREEHFRALLKLGRDIQNDCADGERVFKGSRVREVERFLSRLASEARSAEDKRLLAFLRSRVHEMSGRRCSLVKHDLELVLGVKP